MKKSRLKHLLTGLPAAAQSHMDLKNLKDTEEFLEALIKLDKWRAESKDQQRGTSMPDCWRQQMTLGRR